MNIYKLISWVLVVLAIAIIFNLSSQVAYESNELSKGVTKIIIEVIEKIIPGVRLEVKDLNHIIRKNAHFFSYLVLGLLLINALKASGISGYKGAAFAIGICVFYAIIDEIHQLFVPGRGGQLKDVLIDTAGSIVGVFTYLMIIRFFKRDKLDKLK